MKSRTRYFLRPSAHLNLAHVAKYAQAHDPLAPYWLKAFVYTTVFLMQWLAILGTLFFIIVLFYV